MITCQQGAGEISKLVMTHQNLQEPAHHQHKLVDEGQSIDIGCSKQVCLLEC